mmetsp:Transcript_25708/g.40812  ORF Transcript_25708/g.40812 Transcript_25708/m.40812 type:complete len:175 (+) Transcript_25708:62-586(+)|eukprot:CAMPEP_0197054718 /NCGR_PEP_ID=MMETSP1384-20130603/48679_1 /TAXON_ID=29189 /ORGANISM="Ammonia sp." /LENGTH=174 /DNA_ID=CAMNT_0042487999 /DNA_START=60 /DNA_END=584 /DNA_ORIENTATION=+
MGDTPSSNNAGDYSSHNSFGSAFKAAHSTHGSGHEFTYNNKRYTTNCADGKEYRTGPTSTFTYNKSSSSFTGAGSTHEAHSGLPGWWDEATKNAGPTPSGQYRVSSVTYDPNKSVPRRANITPVGHDAKGRTFLQVHKPSENPLKAAAKLDSRGCIVTDGAGNVKVGDIVHVKD